MSLNNIKELLILTQETKNEERNKKKKNYSKTPTRKGVLMEKKNMFTIDRLHAKPQIIN